MLYCSFGNGYRLTGNSHYLDVMKTGAQSLVTRYDKTVLAIKSWESSSEWQFPVIIDNMMNLEFYCSWQRRVKMRVIVIYLITMQEQH